MSRATPERCKICQRPVSPLGHKWGAFLNRDFRVVRCDSFVAVADPSTYYAKLYDEG